MIWQWFWNLYSVPNSLLIISFIVVILILYNCVLKNWNYFSKRNTKFVRGWPIFGNLHAFFFGDQTFADAITSFYRQFPNEPFVGFYELMRPVFIVRDPELVKEITAHNFGHFFNRKNYFDDELDSLLARCLFFDSNNRWKEMRSILSASFTTNKMRFMFDLIDDSTKKFVSKLNYVYQDESGGVEVEIKDLFSRYMTNIIGTCAFGLEVDAVNDRNDQFYLSAQKMATFGFLQVFKLLLLEMLPKIMKYLRIHFLDEKVCDYFRNIVSSTISYRKKNSIVRPDMIHLMMMVQADGNEKKRGTF